MRTAFHQCKFLIIRCIYPELNLCKDPHENTDYILILRFGFVFTFIQNFTVFIFKTRLIDVLWKLWYARCTISETGLSTVAGLLMHWSLMHRSQRLPAMHNSDSLTEETAGHLGSYIACPKAQLQHSEGFPLWISEV